MLSGLQQQVASIIDKLPEAREFVLAGGAALIARGTWNGAQKFSTSSGSIHRGLIGFLRLRREELERDAGGFERLLERIAFWRDQVLDRQFGNSMTAIEVLRMTSRWGLIRWPHPANQSSRCRGGVKRGLGRHARWVVPVAGWAGGGGEGGI